MIEMLGVLAIIGVLTVGSIAGYSHAMRRHLLNKQREQISTILNALETTQDFLRPSKLGLDLPSGTVLTPYLINLDLIPEDMISQNSVHDVFGNSIYAYFYPTANEIRIRVVDKKIYDQCINLIETAKEHSMFLRDIRTYLNHRGSAQLAFTAYGDKYCSANKLCLRNITFQQMSSACKACKQAERYCVFFYLWE